MPSRLAIRFCGAATAIIITACHASTPPRIQFAPPGTDVARLRSDFALTDAERLALTPDTIKQLDQAQVDQIYQRLDSGPIPNGPFRGDLFFPRGTKDDIKLGELSGVPLGSVAELATMRVENLGKALWRGKVFFRSQGVLRNRIEDIAILKPLIKDSESIPKLTFDGATTWLLFPAKLSCGESKFDRPTSRSSSTTRSARRSKAIGRFPTRWPARSGWTSATRCVCIRPGFYLGVPISAAHSG